MKASEKGAGLSAVEKRKAANGGVHPGGRPGVSDERRKVQGSIRLTQAQWDKIERNGGIDWLRGVIDRARDSKGSAA